MPWKAIAYVGSGLTLAAFIVAVAAWVYRTKVLERERTIRLAPDNERTQLIERTLEFFDINTSGLSRQQKYDLALHQIHERARRFRITAVVVVVVACLAAGVSVFAILRVPTENRHIVSTPTLSTSPDNPTQGVFTFAFNPPSPVTFTGEPIEITATLHDTNNQTLTTPIRWELLDDSDSQYVSISQDGNTIKITKRSGANINPSGNTPRIIGFGVSARPPGAEQEPVTDEINLVVPPIGTSRMLDRQLPFEAASQPRSVGDGLRASLISPELVDARPSSYRLASFISADITSQLLRLGGSATQTGRRPLVFIIDNGVRVYNPATAKNTATNAHDIYTIIKDLQIDPRVEPVNPGWQKEDVIVGANPDLIIIHWHSFCFKKTTCKSIENRFPQVLAYIASRNKRVKFLVYSRDRRVMDREPYGKRRYLLVQGYKAQLEERQLNVDDVIDRVYPFYVKRAPNAFCDAASALNLRSEVKRILRLP